jgi:hypothetical protein
MTAAVLVYHFGTHVCCVWPRQDIAFDRVLLWSKEASVEVRVEVGVEVEAEARVRAGIAAVQRGVIGLRHSNWWNGGEVF